MEYHACFKKKGRVGEGSLLLTDLERALHNNTVHSSQDTEIT